MFTKTKLALATALALTAGTFAATAALAAQADRPAGHQMRGPGGFGMLGGPALKQLNLSEAQKTQLKAIAEKYRTQAKVGDMKAERQQLKTLLTADQVDAAALKSFLQARGAEMRGKAPQRTAMLAEMRAVLTDAQRAQLVKALDQRSPKHKAEWQGRGKQMGDRLVADLNLTAAQKAKFDALKAKMKALRADQPGAKSKDALKAFIQTGNQAAFQASMAANRPQLPVEEIVAVATSLDKGQREKLVAKFDRFAGLGGDRHHGGHRGGHRGHGSHQ